MIKFFLGLIALVFGMQLLAQTKKDNLSNFYKYVSWTVIALSILGILCGGVCSLCQVRCSTMKRMGFQRECMMGNGCYGGNCGWHRGGRGMGGCCNGMMMGGCCNNCGNGCNGMMGGGCYGMGNNCSDGRRSCNDMMGGGCKDNDEMEGESVNGMDGGACPMMSKGGQMKVEKRDTVIKEKKK